MLTKKVTGVFVMMLIAAIGVLSAEVRSDDVTSMKMVWFDSSGAYHYSNPLPYLNDVLQGKVENAELRGILKNLSKDAERIEKEHLPLIASAIDPLRHTFALYYPDDELIARTRDKVVNHFSAESETMANVTIRSYSFQIQGNVSMMSMGTGQNILIAVPADPAILTKATNKIVDDELVLFKLLKESTQTDQWKELSQTVQPGPDGTTVLFNLKPGPWIVFIDQSGLITQCYRMVVKPNQPNNLIADKVAAVPRSRIKLHVDEDKE